VSFCTLVIAIYSRGAQQGGTISSLGMLSTLDPVQLRASAVDALLSGAESPLSYGELASVEDRWPPTTQPLPR
jgi:hypothetical protein